MEHAAVTEPERQGASDVILKGTSVHAEICDLLADIRVEQAFANNSETNIEAVFTFPVPLDAVLLDLSVVIGERVLTGVVMEKKEASERYEDAVTDGDRAVMLVEAGPGLYTVNVGNLQPGESLAVRYRFNHLLRWSGDNVRFHLPTTIAPRFGDPYSFGMDPHQVPEHSLAVENRCSIRVDVKGALHELEADVACPSHAVRVSRDEGITRIALGGETTAMDRDFVLNFKAGGAAKASAVLGRDRGGSVVLASFCPEFGTDEQRPINLKVLVDCSGSMCGDSIAQARKALDKILDALTPRDLFSITAFGNGVKRLFKRQTPVDASALAKARGFVGRLDADMGGTEMEGALDAVYRSGGGETSPDVLLITDGEVWGEEGMMRKAGASRHRVFTVGVGSSVAEDIVRGLADRTGGACELVMPNEEMGERIFRHFQRITRSRASKIYLTWPVDGTVQVPEEPANVFSGDTLHFFGFFTEPVSGEVECAVELENGETLRQKADIKPFESGEDEPGEDRPGSIARLGMAGHLRAAMESCGDSREKKLLDSALDYQLMSPLTNCLLVDALDDAERATDLPELRKIAQTLAAGWHGVGSVEVDACMSVLECKPCYIRTMGDRMLGGMPRGTASGVEDFEFDEDEFEIPAIIRRIAAERTGEEYPVETVVVLTRHLEMEGPESLDREALESAGVPEEVFEVLDAVASRGYPMHAVVLVFVHLLFKKHAGAAAKSRDRARALAKHCKDGYSKETMREIEAILAAEISFVE